MSQGLVWGVGFLRTGVAPPQGCLAGPFVFDSPPPVLGPFSQHPHLGSSLLHPPFSRPFLSAAPLPQCSLSGSPRFSFLTSPHPLPELLTPHLPVCRKREKSPHPPWEGGRPGTYGAGGDLESLENLEREGPMPPTRHVIVRPLLPGHLVLIVNGPGKALRQVSSPLQASVSTSVKWTTVLLCKEGCWVDGKNQACYFIPQTLTMCLTCAEY